MYRSPGIVSGSALLTWAAYWRDLDLPLVGDEIREKR
jgi:hypothetical protein